MEHYKNTLNLPQTQFSMKAQLAQREPERLKRWQAENLYEKIQKARENCPTYILHDGPPYANGAIHLGHATNKILKDMIIKSKVLEGFKVPFVPGWDCHGLPIEINVEKKFGRAGEKLSAAEFREACRAYARSQIEIQKAGFVRLGVLGDWDHPYTTIDPVFEANIIRALAKIIHNGHMTQGFRPVHWCLDCKSALAEAEVEYKEKHSPSIHITFPVVDHAGLNTQIPAIAQTRFIDVAFAVWTTTPWTLPSNRAVAVNPEVTYAFVAINRGQGPECLIMAEDRVNEAMLAYGFEHYEIFTTALGTQLEGILVQHPWMQETVPVVLSEHVTVDSGTGCVHIAPGHGEDDYKVGLRYHLSIEHRVDARGVFVGDTPVVAGLSIFKANDVIVETLREQRRLLAHATIEHSYPHCWRHRTPIIFRATPQWFISMEQEGLRDDALAAIECVEWIPAWGQQRIYNMIKNRPDWCISRQRTWTMPITSYIHKQTGELHPETQRIMETVAKMVEEKGMEAWYDYADEALIGDDAKDYQKITDGLDVWFDSGVTHKAVLETRPDLSAPADLYLEGSDQHRGWFHSSLLTRVAIDKQAPYRKVLTHGFLLDGNGRKMSKSLGNDVAPEKVIQQSGADILRLWVAASDYRNDMAYSEEIMSRTVDAYRRIRNTARFLLANLDGFNPATDLVALKDCVALDRYMIARAQILQNEIRAHYEAFEFHAVYQKVLQACSMELGSFYLDIIKDRQYTAQKTSLARRSAQTALYHWVQALVRWVTPMIPFTAEEIWEHIPHQTGCLFTQTWYNEFPPALADEPFDVAFWQRFIPVRDIVNQQLETARKAGLIGSALDARVILWARGSIWEDLSAIQSELRFALITSEVKLLPWEHENSNTELSDLSVEIQVSEYGKCERCWQKRPDVGTHEGDPTLCGRCVENVHGSGEIRHYA